MTSSNPVPQLDGKRVLVSGAASGMGAACVELARERGASVFAVDRDEAGLTALADRLDVSWELCDLARVEVLPGLVARCAAELGGLDGLVNAAGVWQTRELLELTPEDWDMVIGVNLRGLFFLQQAAARVMVQQGNGSIVNFASIAARVPHAWSSHYGASKAGVLNITKSAGEGLARHGVRVNAVVPGDIETPMHRAVRQESARVQGTTPDEVHASMRASNPMGRIGTPREVAEVVVFLLADASSFVNGEAIGVTGGTDY